MAEARRDGGIVAVVLTYRRQHLLPRVLEAIVGQTRPPDGILVVDNNEPGDPLDVGDGIEVIRAGANIGSAAGYTLGITEALSRDAGWVWLVDDDVLPDARCLERLVEVDAEVVIPGLRWVDGKRVWEVMSGGLVSRKATELAPALFPTEYFWWEAPRDFLYRLERAGGRVVRVDEPLASHLRPARHRRGEPRDWRLYYMVRNTLHFRLRVMRPGRRTRRRLAWSLVKTAAAIVAFEPHKRRSLALLVRGILDYRAGRLGKRVDPETWNCPRRARRRPDRVGADAGQGS